MAFFHFESKYRFFVLLFFNGRFIIGNDYVRMYVAFDVEFIFCDAREPLPNLRTMAILIKVVFSGFFLEGRV